MLRALLERNLDELRGEKLKRYADTLDAMLWAYLPRAYRTDFAQAYLCHHALKPCARDTARRRPAQIFIHDFDVMPPELTQATLHGVLQLLALKIVEHLVCGGLTYI